MAGKEARTALPGCTILPGRALPADGQGRTGADRNGGPVAPDQFLRRFRPGAGSLCEDAWSSPPFAAVLPLGPGIRARGALGPGRRREEFATDRALWSGPSAQQNSGAAEWQTAIITKLVQAGDFRSARAAWQQFAGLGSVEPGVFNPEFRKLQAPPPFNWTFGSAGGLAQPSGSGQLDLIYFGRQDTVLAEQLTLLPPGRYVIGMQVSGDVKAGSGLAWSIECVAPKKALLTLPVERQSAGRLQAGFAVPGGCPAQRLQLAGSPGELSRAIEFTLSRFQLVRSSGQ